MKNAGRIAVATMIASALWTMAPAEFQVWLRWQIRITLQRTESTLRECLQ